MISLIYIVLISALALGVSALVYRWMKTYLAYAFVSATVSALLLQLIGFVYYGRIDEWAYIAFFVTWPIGFACATVYFFAVRANKQDRGERSGS